MTAVHLVTWPPNSRVSFYNGRGKLLWQASASRYDLAENLMFGWDKASRQIHFGFSTKNKHWTKWTEETISLIETVIRDDFSYDAYRVNITRTSTKIGAKCSEEFVWKLKIRGGLKYLEPFYS
jgi:hypothetical protein